MAFRRSKENEDPKSELEKPFFKEYREILNEKISRLVKIECKIVSIKSFDGLTLYARYYHTKDGAPLQIQCHGYRGNPLRDFSGGGLAALDNGYNVLMIYQRAHALSEGKTITFGENERILALSYSEIDARIDAQVMALVFEGGQMTVLPRRCFSEDVWQILCDRLSQKE